MIFKGLVKHFFYGGVFYLIVGLILRSMLPNAAIDIQLHDIYLVIGMSHAAFILGFFWLMDSCVYTFIKRQPMPSWQKIMGWISCGVLHIACVLIVWIPLSQVSSSQLDRRYYRFDGFEMYAQQSWIPIGIFLLCLTQVVILMSFLVSLIRFIRKR